ncbi:ABC transporter ATP-binding protein [Chlorobium phaeovibrioides]|uniref:ABC transporter ATP-binding protein n=2 Tax=Chlorobium phaeovibrioides TaxID=1094 RepID=A0A432ATU7_CHLPH|nr:ABC transporter ATP-binding protein [Chlorobium phaeovibrioides]HCD36532.1 ABC transporter ATP-binding protein [Chlorobium sp.]KAA6231860.1 ABC transporter ATP-binding protein [Chlorobium phaeovibrioides]MWV53475.1 ATP-binding cassette domain-containing protein [Chlorobium phaeovibrioides]QEQ57583.1 ABC transporter ATP-binding protein [Chlorobium phaeovibrioides]RTY34477.1 ABC transporter ATP-binding protein [Chlorobium phaeovibrioides]
MSGPVIVCDRLAVRLGGTQVLNRLTLSVFQGDFLGIVGPNGGGKTTLLRVILGLQRPTEGSVRVFGSEPGSQPKRTGYVPQRLFFDRDFPLSVGGLVLMGRLSRRRLFRPYGNRDRQAVEEALHTVGLGDLRDRQVGALSGGELQRALIARALAGEPELLLLDEPTASIDPAMKSSVYDLLDSLRGRMTIVMVSHDTGVITKHVTRIACLNCTLDMHEEGSSLKRAPMGDFYDYPVDAILHNRPKSEGSEP